MAFVKFKSKADLLNWLTTETRCKYAKPFLNHGMEILTNCPKTFQGLHECKLVCFSIFAPRPSGTPGSESES